MLRYGKGSKQLTIVSFSCISVSRRSLIENTLDTKQRLVEHVIPSHLTLNLTILTSLFRVDKRFFTPSVITSWIVIVYEQRQRFGDVAVKNMLAGLTESFREVGVWNFYPLLQIYPLIIGVVIGITVTAKSPLVKWENGQGKIHEQLLAAGTELVKRDGTPPTLIVIILPEGGNDIYTAVKQYALPFDCFGRY